MASTALQIWTPILAWPALRAPVDVLIGHCLLERLRRRYVAHMRHIPILRKCCQHVVHMSQPCSHKLLLTLHLSLIYRRAVDRSL